MGLFDFLGSVVSGFAGYKSQQATNESNQKMAADQRAWEEDMWNKNNEYNSPAAQLERMRDAGFDPVTEQMTGSQAISSGNSSGPPNSYQMIPNQDPMQAAGNFSQAIHNANNLMEDAMLKGQTRKFKVAEAQKQVAALEESISSMQLDNATKTIALSFADAERRAALAEANGRALVSFKTAEKLDAEYDNLRFELDKILPAQLFESETRSEKNRSDVKLNSANFKLVTQKYENAIKEAELIDAQTGTEIKKQDLLAAQTKESAASTELKHAQTDVASNESAEKRWSAANLRKSYDEYCATYEDRVQQMANQTKISNRDVKSYWIRVGLDGIKSVGAASGGIGLLHNAFKAAAK